MGRRATIRDVAARAGVHPATASRALNPALPGRVAAETARRVVEAARELGYRPDPAARSLRTRRSGLVGVVVPDIANPVIPPIVRGVENVLWSAGIACLLADTDNDPDREAALIAELRARRCDGLIVATATRADETVAHLADEEVPTVLVTRAVEGADLPLVAGDDASGVRAAVAHLRELGHERIAHLTGPLELSTTVRRLEAFRDAVGVDDPVVLHGEGFTIPTGRTLAAQLLERHPETTAILAGNDMIAVGCYDVLAAAGLRVPDDMSVVGHNDMPLVDSLSPPLTTVAIPQEEIGEQAARILLDRLAGDSPDGSAVRLMPTELVVRGSTAPPRRA
jgi:LacI family transcriptional regulator